MEAQDQFSIQIQGFQTFQIELQPPQPDPQPECVDPSEFYNMIEDPPISIYTSIGKRQRNLDKFSYVQDDDYLIIGLFDGHGDDSVSIFLQNNLIRKIIEHPQFEKFPILAIKQTFQEIQQILINDIETFPNSKSGSTALILLMKKQDGQIYIANLGDTQAYALKNNFNEQKQNQWVQITSKHNLSVQSQLQSVIEKGALLFKRGNQFRINGQMLLSRAFGSRDYKNIISAQPQISLINKKQMKTIILGTDGFWQQMSQKSTENITKIIMKIQDQLEALSEFNDNATVCIVEI